MNSSAIVSFLLASRARFMIRTLSVLVNVYWSRSLSSSCSTKFPKSLIFWIVTLLCCPSTLNSSCRFSIICSMVRSTELSSDIFDNNLKQTFKGINSSRDLKSKLYLICSFQVSSIQFLHCVDEAIKKVQWNFSLHDATILELFKSF